MSAIFDSSSPYGYGGQASSSKASQATSLQDNPEIHSILQQSIFQQSVLLLLLFRHWTRWLRDRQQHVFNGRVRPRISCSCHDELSMGFWSAFGTGGFPDEPPLMEELGINIGHIVDKTLTVLNPLHRYSSSHAKDAHMMDDADLAGKSQFGYVYGVALLGAVSIYTLLNLMSEGGIDAYRVASVLATVCFLSVFSAPQASSSFIGYIVSPLFILWCSTSASGIFVSILRLSEQRLLVAYPVGLFYACFALLSVFDVGQ
ncbi:related to YIP1 - Golgi integral membrane protein [Ustilago trichophora]|uniref:Related to YIP1 - Golgi integral membrane protein n=1 Tax=Ustilago trichophora TaxID=86804 RepID=A0A5C3E932_9BASI|nr:related to YIP1 - Golgi integral membrane protein [Ustilago trichophora]